jgi:hypothetical protein
MLNGVLTTDVSILGPGCSSVFWKQGSDVLFLRSTEMRVVLYARALDSNYTYRT